MTWFASSTLHNYYILKHLPFLRRSGTKSSLTPTKLASISTIFQYSYSISAQHPSIPFMTLNLPPHLSCLTWCKLLLFFWITPSLILISPIDCFFFFFYFFCPNVIDTFRLWEPSSVDQRARVEQRSYENSLNFFNEVFHQSLGNSEILRRSSGLVSLQLTIEKRGPF